MGERGHCLDSVLLGGRGCMSALRTLPLSRGPVGFSQSVGEKIPMTLRFGLVGTDGIVLASDKKVGNNIT
jgi:hypothetical protein